LALGEVRLDVPASPEFFRLARIMVAGVASRGGFTLDALDDLRLAIDELCFALVGEGREGRLQLTLRLIPGGIEVEGDARFADLPKRGPVLSALSQMILGTVVDGYEVILDASARFRMVKRIAQVS